MILDEKIVVDDLVFIDKGVSDFKLI
jgi:hypothetical protein